VENYPIEVIRLPEVKPFYYTIEQSFDLHFRLFNALLPGIDVNDMYKSTDIFVLFSDLLEMVWVVDFSGKFFLKIKKNSDN